MIKVVIKYVIADMAIDMLFRNLIRNFTLVDESIDYHKITRDYLKTKGYLWNEEKDGLDKLIQSFGSIVYQMQIDPSIEAALDVEVRLLIHQMIVDGYLRIDWENFKPTLTGDEIGFNLEV